jgi:hypothetical protein
MADMIDAKEAKQILGCDDDTLNNHINGGAVRAQRIGGKLMVNKEDVQKLASEQDDGTIVLTGDSDNLQIDLGKVVDDTSETLIHDKTATKKGNATDSITFGDELEVVNFDDKKTQDVGFDDSKKTMDLNFTDQNTGVMTAVDETQVGGATAQLDTSNEAAVGGPGSGESRRSVRSNRSAPIEMAPVHPIWVALMVLTTLIMAFLITPYGVMSAWARGDDKDAARNQARGVDDNAWTNMAGGMAGFSVEPDAKRFKQLNGDAEHKKIDGAESRIEKYRGQFKADGEKRDTYVIDKISEDGKQAISKGDKVKWPLVEVKTTSNGMEITEEVVNIGLLDSK